MKDEKLVERLIRERVMELVTHPVFEYKPLDPEWEPLIQGGDGNEEPLRGLHPEPNL